MKDVVYVLTSGGLDSAACLSYYLEQDYPVRAVWVDYGQRAAHAEIAAAERIASYYQVPLSVVRISGIHWPELGGDLFEYRGRNLTLVSIALNTAETASGLITLGVHQGTPFADCSTDFVNSLDSLVSALTSSRFRLDCPFVQWSKADIAAYCAAHRIPWHLTYSCERGCVPPCGECVKCRDIQTISTITGDGSADSGDGL